MGQEFFSSIGVIDAFGPIEISQLLHQSCVKYPGHVTFALLRGSKAIWEASPTFEVAIEVTEAEALIARMQMFWAVYWQCF